MAITFLDEEKEQPKGGITFLDDAGQPGISMLEESRPLTGGEINQFLSDDPGYARRMSLKDYEEYRRYKADNPVTVDAIGQALTKVGQDLSGAASAVAKNITSPGAIISALGRGAVVGTADLGDIIDRIVTFDKAPDTYNLYRAKKNLPDNEDTRKKYDELLAKDFATFQESQDYQAARAGVVQGSDIPEVTEASTYFLDPTVVAPGAQAAKIGTIADKAIGAAVRTAGKTARMVTRPAVEAVEGIAKTAAEVAGPAAKGAAAATGVTGAIMGVPGVRETVGAYAGLKTVDKAAEVAERVGESLMGQPSRIGALEAMGSVPNATAIDRAIGVVGRRGGDAAIDVLNAAAGGAVAGAAIGGALGFAAEGEEGLYGGIGSGLALGSLGAGLGRTVERVKGRAVAEARAADLARFTEALDEPTRELFKRVIDRDGPDQAVMVMDGAALLRSQFDDAKVTFLPDTEFKERFGGSARGVQLETAGRPEIVINVDKPVSAYTFGHELFHAFDSVEQLKPQAEAIKQEIVGTFVQQPDGTFSQVKAGLLSPAEVDVAFKQYQRKLAQSGVATREWFSAKNEVEKAKLVGKELASEYMARMVTGGDVDGLLRGYDGITRTLLDQALINQGEGVIRGIAERLGLGSAPVESMLFKNLKEASPTLNAMLRDVIRARRNLSERMVLSEDSGVVIRQQDIGKPVVADKALKMGVAERRPDGTVVMKDDSVLAREEDAETQAIRSAIEAAPVADPTKPHLRVVDGEIRGAGISPEQVAAISASPGVTNKLKAVLGSVSESLAAHSIPDAPNGLWVEYGAATRRVKSRLTGKYTSKYSSGIRLSQREVVPYELYISKAGNPVAKVVDVSKLRTTATDLASAGRLGPYERDISGFLSDSVRYFDNISDPSGVRTRELPGMTDAKATFLNQYFGSQEKGGARFIRDLRLDRITEIRPTGERMAASELAWQRQKVNWMPAEKMPDGSVISSNEGFRIISKNGKFSLYSPDGQRVGIYDTQAKAEQKAALQADKFAGEEARNVPINEDLPAGQREDVAKWISTRKPTAKNAHEDALKQNLAIDSKAVLLDSDATRTVANLVKKYPGFKTTKTKPAEIVAEFRDFVVDNLLYLHDSMAPELRDRAQKWYDGARVITERWSEKYGVKREAVAAVLASLSPQTDWFRNVSQAQRVIEVFKNQQNTAMTPQMEGWLINYYAGDGDGAKIVDAMRGKRFADLTTYEKAVWTRAFDQNHNDRKYNILTPEGEFATLVTNKDGSPATLAWGNFNTIANAISVLENPSRMTISERLGGEHKVRSFYNNILLPMLRSYGDVTIDTHAVAAALLRPLAGADTEVTHNLGAGISSSVSGASGIYGIYADAYRIAAEMRGILPRQMQSITWEAVRGLFEATWKTQANKALVNSIWNEYKSGKISKDEARSQITKAAGGITTPDWARPDNRGTEKAGPSSDSGEVPQADAGRSSSRANQRGVGNAAAGEFASANLMPDAAEEYRGQHTAPGRDSAPAHDLIGNGVYPKDVYQRPDWYEQGDGLAVMRRVLALKDRPDAKVAIYRAIPTEVYKREMAAAEKSGEPFLNRVIRPGDWVTIDKIYAKEHGESALNGDFKVVHKNVPASHIFTNGDSIMEWGYHPDTAKAVQGNFMPAAPSQAISSADTSLQQVPALFKSKTFVPRGTNLDIGAGKFDLGKQYLERERGVTESVPFDPFNRDAETNRLAVERLQSGERFATTTIPNVLNVIAERSVRDNVILQAARALDPKGVAYFQIYEGDRLGDGRQTSKGYQNNKKTSDYVDEVRRHFGDVRTSGNVIVASGPKVTGRKAFWQLSPEGPSLRFMPDTPEFRQWFGNSKAVNADGTPLVVYRGEHGEGEKGSVQSREASISFGSKSAAQEYSRSPNNRSDVAKNPRVIAANLKIERPFLNAPEDPFVEMSAIQSALGKDEAVKIAKKFSDVIERTDNWQNNFAERYASVADLLSKRPHAINDLYLQAYPVLADHDVVKKLKAAGFDGAIHGGSGQTAGAPEYKVFDRSQINIVGDDRETRFMPDGLARISDNLERAGIKNDVSESGGLIRIHRMVVPADKRNQGLGSGAMQQLVNYADETGKRIALSPSTDFGGSSVSRLKDFYRRFGFVDNKGRDQDLAVSETMIREPKLKVNFMPESMPNGTVYRSNIGFTVVNKNGGKFRVYSPVGILVAVANTLEESQRMIERKAK